MAGPGAQDNGFVATIRPDGRADGGSHDQQLQTKLAGVGRTDDKLDAESAALAERVAAWRAHDEGQRPKAKRAAALNVVQQ